MARFSSNLLVVTVQMNLQWMGRLQHAINNKSTYLSHHVASVDHVELLSLCKLQFHFIGDRIIICLHEL